MDVTLSISENIALITLDDGKKNAITLDALANINNAMDEAEAKASAIVIAGRPGAFCAGFDLATMTSGDTGAIEALARAGGMLTTRFYGQGKPLVAACTGHAFTIGAFWLLACDTRVGERGDFKYGFNETAMGVALTDWGFELLKARINPRLFVPVVAQSRIFDPEGAMEAGFLDELADANASVEAGLATAAELAALPAKAYAYNKLAPREATLNAMRNDLL